MEALKSEQKFASDLYISSLIAAEKAKVDSLQQQDFSHFKNLSFEKNGFIGEIEDLLQRYYYFQ